MSTRGRKKRKKTTTKRGRKKGSVNKKTAKKFQTNLVRYIASERKKGKNIDNILIQAVHDIPRKKKKVVKSVSAWQKDVTRVDLKGFDDATNNLKKVKAIAKKLGIRVTKNGRAKTMKQLLDDIYRATMK